MQNQDQDQERDQEREQQSGDLEQTEQGQGSSGLESQDSEMPDESTDDNQNDLAGNASGNTPDDLVENLPSGMGGSDISGEDSIDRPNNAMPTDGPISEEGSEDSDELTNIETDEDDDLEIRD